MPLNLTNDEEEDNRHATGNLHEDCNEMLLGVLSAVNSF